MSVTLDKTTSKLWFKAKKYGYGWYPATWQGWTIMVFWLVYVLLKVADFAKDVSISDEPVGEMIGVFGLDILMVTALFLVICYLSG